MKIAVIGAGLSGIKIASLLLNKGHEVTVFEKSRGFGGRLAHKRLDWANLDIGAQYFTARDPSFIKEVEQWCQDGHVARWSFSPHRVEHGRLLESPDETVRYIGQPSMNQPVKTLGVNIQVEWQVEIQKIKRQQNWTLMDADGNAYSGFDWLIVSAPAEQTRNILADNSPITSLIPEAVHQPCWAVGLETCGHVIESIQGIFGDEVIRWVSRLSSRHGFQRKNHDDVWMLHFAPEWSRTHGKKTSLDLAGIGVQWLEGVLNADLQMIESYQHFWRYANLETLDLGAPYLMDDQNKLAVVGAWCAGGRVEGAWVSANHLFCDVFAS